MACGVVTPTSKPLPAHERYSALGKETKEAKKKGQQICRCSFIQLPACRCGTPDSTSACQTCTSKAVPLVRHFRKQPKCNQSLRMKDMAAAGQVILGRAQRTVPITQHTSLLACGCPARAATADKKQTSFLLRRTWRSQQREHRPTLPAICRSVHVLSRNVRA